MDGMRLELFGNVGKELEAKYTPTGKIVVTGSVAVTTGYGEKKETTWVKVVAWEKTGELFNKLVTKGTTVWLSGTPKISTWLSKEGEAKAQMELTVKEFRVLRGGAKNEEPGEDEPDFMKD